jgi:hypothetical protein
MKRSVTTTEPAVAETTRRTTTCTRMKRGHEFLIHPILLPLAVRSHRLIYSRLHALMIAAPAQHAIGVPSKYNEIPTARIALNNGISRYSTHNNAYSRNSENAPPIAQYNEMAPASSCSFVRFVVRKGPASSSRLHLPKSRSIQPYLGASRLKKNSSRSRLNPAMIPVTPVGRGSRRALIKRHHCTRRRRGHETLINSSLPRTLTQTNPSAAQILLSYGANFLSQSDRIRPNLSQRLFRQSFRPNLTYGQVRVPSDLGLCPAVPRL